MKRPIKTTQVSPALLLKYVFDKMDLATLKNMIEKLTELHESKCLDEIERTE